MLSKSKAEQLNETKLCMMTDFMKYNGINLNFVYEIYYKGEGF